MHPEGYEINSGKDGARVCYTIVEQNAGDPKFNDGNTKYFLAASTDSLQEQCYKVGMSLDEASFLRTKSFAETSGAREAALAECQQLCAENFSQKMNKIQNSRAAGSEKN